MFIDPNIDRVLREAMRREGWRDGDARLIDHPADSGGLTRGGVTARSWGEYRNFGRPATGDELLTMTYDEAREFYWRRYVVLPGFDQVPDQKLRALLVDWAFTSWFDDPTKAVQTALKARGLYTGAIDGILGPKTRAAVFADRDPRQTFRAVFNARIDFYVMLALTDGLLWALLKRADPSGRDAATLQIANLRGWLRRVCEFTP
jgi:lysozyme family protein